jgi:predicted nucleic acid-binding protein
VILIDANLLLYPYDPDSPQHEVSRRWLEEVLSGSDLVRFPFISTANHLSPSQRVRC